MIFKAVLLFLLPCLWVAVLLLRGKKAHFANARLLLRMLDAQPAEHRRG